jgi:hypothetical protein
MVLTNEVIKQNAELLRSRIEKAEYLNEKVGFIEQALELRDAKADLAKLQAECTHEIVEVRLSVRCQHNEDFPKSQRCYLCWKSL